MKQDPGRILPSFLPVLNRMEPDVTTIDKATALASIAISLKRIADSNDRIAEEINQLSVNIWRRDQA